MEAISPFTPLKLLRHRDKVEAMLAGEQVYPVSVELDASLTCSHSCPWCSFGSTESHGYRQQNWVTFPTARFLTLIDELAEVGVKSITFTGGGEPLVHKAIGAAFEKCVEHGIQFGVVTNGWGLIGEARRLIAQYATFVRVSLDAGTEETHLITHRPGKPQFHQIVANIAETRRLAGDRLTIGASFCVMDANYKEIYAAAKHVKDVGGNYLEVRPTFPTEWRGDGWGMALSPEHVEAAQVELAHAKAHLDGGSFRLIGLIDRFNSLSAPAKRYARCHIGPLVTVISADQKIWHCCVQRGQEFFNVASVKDKTFKQAWDDVMARKMAESIDVSKCPRCRHDGFNEVIEGAFIQDGMHRDFL